MTKEKENELIEQITKIGLYLAEVQAENRILKDINDKLMQALRIYNTSGPASAVNGGGELLAGALAKTVCGGFKDCTDVKGIMCKCEGVCELKD